MEGVPFWESRIADPTNSGRDLALFAVSGPEVCGLAWCKVAGGYGECGWT